MATSRSAPHDRVQRCAASKEPMACDSSASRRLAGGRRPAPKVERRVLLLSSGLRGEDAAGVVGTDSITDTEIAQLVSVALEGALCVLEEPNPTDALESRALEGRAAMREALASLPGVQASDPTVQEEYEKAIIFQEISRRLAVAMVDAFESYASAICADDPAGENGAIPRRECL